MIDRGVSRNKVEKNVHTALMYLTEEHFQLLVRSVSGGGGIVVGNVVSSVSERGHKARIHPYGIAAEILNVVKLFGNTCEITYSVGVRILERLGINFIENRVFKPLGLISSHNDILPFNNKLMCFG